MAAGDVKDQASVVTTAASSSSFLTMGGVTANVGDLVYVLYLEQTTNTLTGITDNLGNAYTALATATDAGTVTARAIYSRVTVGGSLTRINKAVTSSANNTILLAALFEGPVTTSPLDKNPANITSDITSPLACPPTGVLTQASELVISWGATLPSTSLVATSPMVAVVTDSDGETTVRGTIASKVVAATTTTTPGFTCSSNPTECILATTTFKLALVETVTVTQATVTLAGKTVTVREHERPAVAKATVTLTGKTVTVGDTELVPVAKASVTIAGQSVDIVEVTSIIPVTAATVLLTGQDVIVADDTPTTDVIVVHHATIALAGKTITVSDFPTLITVASATIALTGKPVTVRDLQTILVNQATVTFAGKTVTVSTSTFQDIPKYTIRGRGSRHELWTNGFGGTIKGRGSRAFLVMR